MLNKFFNSSLNIFFFKKLYCPQNIKIKSFFFKNQQILILQNISNNEVKFSQYFLIPTFVNYVYKDHFLYLILKSQSLIKYKILYFFLIHLNLSLKQLHKISATTFLIKGVGLKISLSENSFSLNLKLGFSHLLTLTIPKDILNIAIFKKKIILCSFNRVLLGNFASTIFKYKPINIFTGKGLLKKQKKKFKLKEYVKKI